MLLKILLFVFVAFLAFLVNQVHLAGEFDTIKPHSQGKCKLIPSGPGLEDFDVGKGDVLYITSDDRHCWNLMGSEEPDVLLMRCRNTPGALLHFDTNTEKMTPMTLVNFENPDFHPHGISYLADGEKEYLYVVNHRVGSDAVELFLIKGKEAHWLRAFTSPLFTGSNDVYATATEIYVTQWFTNPKSTLKGAMELWASMPWTAVVSCANTREASEAAKCSIAADGIKMSNGVYGSPDHKQLYVISTTGKELRVYDRATNGSLTLSKVIPTQGGCDNIIVSPDGTLYTACHTKMMSFMLYSAKVIPHSPCNALKWHPGDNTPTEIFATDGSDFSAGSVAYVHNGKLYQGAVHQNGLFVCEGY